MQEQALMNDEKQVLLDVRDLDVEFHSDFGDRIVTDKVSYQVGVGETLGIVGESGCGKSVTSLAVMGLLPRNGRVIGGEVLFDGRNLLALKARELDRVRGKDICMIFQDALASLNPVFSVGNQITEAIRAHTEKDKKAAQKIAVEMLGRVGLPDPAGIMKKYSFELSGGQRQRVCIAMALAVNPRLLIADEITTALDVTIQSQIMRMIEAIRVDMGMSMVLITHDIGLIAEMSDRVIVMYEGQIIEQADVFTLFAHPAHPYTQMLIDATPGILDSPDKELHAIPGNVPENYSDIRGCRFAARCPYYTKACDEPQMLTDLGDGHMVRCARNAGGVSGAQR